ncbi:ATPase, AFG1 family [hydrothermal vent metagenome]|uniref:ATPase, AFG1 family n=1 Tax=hydrothermal vent metagenome TaxID=652676 RepID=A0A3B1AS98_9ZZZZ
MQLIDQYRQITTEPGFHFEASQALAVAHLQALGDRLIHRPPSPPRPASLVGRLFARKPPAPIPGLYLWGGVGRGKTWLMDLFFETLPFEQKLRLHFHRFMQEIEDELAHLRRQRDPLRIVAHRFAGRTRILCLDELYVEDITNAMLLHGLLTALTNEGISLVFTSNTAPQGLYKNGLQRERFLPVIALIEQHTQVFELRGDTDHRLRHLQKADTWYTPADTHSEKQLAQRFHELAPCEGRPNRPLLINHRPIACHLYADDVAWFDFFPLCHGPRSSHDYIELARRLHTVFISAVPIMGEEQDDWAHRFIDLVDEFYDRRVKLLVSAAAEPAALYTGQRLAFEFRRTASRLAEMRSTEYQALPHRP